MSYRACRQHVSCRFTPTPCPRAQEIGSNQMVTTSWRPVVAGLPGCRGRAGRSHSGPRLTRAQLPRQELDISKARRIMALQATGLNLALRRGEARAISRTGRRCHVLAHLLPGRGLHYLLLLWGIAGLRRYGATNAPTEKHVDRWRDISSVRHLPWYLH